MHNRSHLMQKALVQMRKQFEKPKRPVQNTGQRKSHLRRSRPACNEGCVIKLNYGKQLSDEGGTSGRGRKQQQVDNTGYRVLEDTAIVTNTSPLTEGRLVGEQFSGNAKWRSID